MCKHTHIYVYIYIYTYIYICICIHTKQLQAAKHGRHPDSKARGPDLEAPGVAAALAVPRFAAGFVGAVDGLPIQAPGAVGVIGHLTGPLTRKDVLSSEPCAGRKGGGVGEGLGIEGIPSSTLET